MDKNKNKGKLVKSKVHKKQVVAVSASTKANKSSKKSPRTKSGSIKKEVKKKRFRRKTSKATLLKRKITLQKKKFVKMFSVSGANVSLVCTLFPISRSTFYDWYKKDDEFAKKIDDAELIPIDIVENQLFKQCTQDADGNKSHGNLTAIMYYLNNKKYHVADNNRKGNKSGKTRSAEDNSKIVVEAMGAITTLQADT